MSSDRPSSCTWSTATMPVRSRQPSASTASVSLAMRPPGDGCGTAQGNRRPAAFGKSRGYQRSGTDLADRQGLCQTQRSRLFARALDIAPAGGPYPHHAASTMHDILNRQPIKPHKVRYYLERRNPAFDEREAEVLEVYAAAKMLRALPEAERPVAVVSYDEKPGIQATAATAPDLPPRPGTYATCPARPRIQTAWHSHAFCRRRSRYRVCPPCRHPATPLANS
jgi:hypothetical protein